MDTTDNLFSERDLNTPDEPRSQTSVSGPKIQIQNFVSPLKSHPHYRSQNLSRISLAEPQPATPHSISVTKSSISKVDPLPANPSPIIPEILTSQSLSKAESCGSVPKLTSDHKEIEKSWSCLKKRKMAHSNFKESLDSTLKVRKNLNLGVDPSLYEPVSRKKLKTDIYYGEFKESFGDTMSKSFKKYSRVEVEKMKLAEEEQKKK